MAEAISEQAKNSYCRYLPQSDNMELDEPIVVDEHHVDNGYKGDTKTKASPVNLLDKQEYPLNENTSKHSIAKHTSIKLFWSNNYITMDKNEDMASLITINEAYQHYINLDESFVMDINQFKAITKRTTMQNQIIKITPTCNSQKVYARQNQTTGTSKRISDTNIENIIPPKLPKTTASTHTYTNFSKNIIIPKEAHITMQAESTSNPKKNKKILGNTF